MVEVWVHCAKSIERFPWVFYVFWYSSWTLISIKLGIYAVFNFQFPVNSWINIQEIHANTLIVDYNQTNDQGSYTTGPSKFHDFSMTIYAKIHDLEKLETTKRAEQGLRQTTGVVGTQPLNWRARPSYDKLSSRVTQTQFLRYFSHSMVAPRN